MSEKKIILIFLDRVLKSIINKTVNINAGKNHKILKPVSILSRAELPIAQELRAEIGLNCCSKIL
ncbi:MAG: Unknown protein [uncultured Sulfurovum sp.]|uniref:Uncharacterized protein n=1 Tax=uncultured Sulfurovum sp. TaxID=269237 RepID=A0A6S6RZN3_9BACT|nr:MAG: Unknown protein [uncultured Sulfurovum sp.]